MTAYREPDHDVQNTTGLAMDLRQYIEIAMRRWWLIVGAVGVCVGAAWWSQRDALPVYNAEVLLQQQVEAPLLGAVPGISGMSDFGSQVEILRSRAVLASAVDMLGLRLQTFSHPQLRNTLFEAISIDPEAPPGAYALESSQGRVSLVNRGLGSTIEGSVSGGRVQGPGFEFALNTARVPQEPVEFVIRNRQIAVESLRGQIRVDQGAGPDLIRVSYRSPDPAHAAEVANAVAESYQQYRAASARQAQGRRRDVIAQEIQLLADSLRRAQQEVESYQSSTRLLNPDVEGNALMSALLGTETDLRQWRFQEGLVESLVAGLQGDDPSDESLRRVMALGRELIPAGPELDARLQGLEAERRGLLANRFGVTASSPEVEVLDAQIASTRDQMKITAEQSLELLRSRIAAAEERVGELRAQIGDLPGRSLEFERLQQRVDAVQQVFDQLVASYYEAQISEGVEDGDVAIVDPAAVPLFPNASLFLLNVGIALVGGLILGMIGSMLLEQFDSKIRRTSDVEQVSGVAVLGEVPSIRSLSGDPKAIQIGVEAYRGIRTNLRFAADRHERPRLLAVCSASPGEGKSTVSVNLALSLVERGERVLLVDGDLRRARLHELLGVDRSPGLSEVLEGKSVLSDAVVPSPLSPSLDVLPSGMATTAHYSLLSGDKFKGMLSSLADQYDTVLIDTPPILAVSDASEIASHVEGNIMVVRADSTNREALSNAVEQLRRVNAEIVGVVLNGVGVGRVGYAEYYDSYHDDGTALRRRGSRRKKLLLAAKQ